MGHIYLISKDDTMYKAYNVADGVIDYAGTDLDVILQNLIHPQGGNATIIVIDETLKIESNIKIKKKQ